MDGLLSTLPWSVVIDGRCCPSTGMDPSDGPIDFLKINLGISAGGSSIAAIGEKGSPILMGEMNPHGCRFWVICYRFLPSPRSTLLIRFERERGTLPWLSQKKRTLKKKMMPEKIEDAPAGDGDVVGDRLLSNQICTGAVVANLLDVLDLLPGMSPVVVLANR
ncbi:hypothetical protein ACLOJK_022195 [Asimina triloba]